MTSRNYDLAFQNYRRGNELLKSVAQKYDRNAHRAFADDMIRGHSQQALAAFGEGGSASIKPIFVVGMPRSGTSLAEQIIASHPAAKGAGESDFWLDAARLHQTELRQGIVGEPTRKKLAEEYLRFLGRRCPDASRVVDKTLINSDYLGLIHSVFPNARIIRMRRDPIDTCLSVLFPALLDRYAIFDGFVRHSGLLPGASASHESLVFGAARGVDT